MNAEVIIIRHVNKLRLPIIDKKIKIYIISMFAYDSSNLFAIFIF